MLDRETAQSLSKDLKIDLFSVYREYLQLLFLKYFYNKKNSEKLYFKGGTALRFLFGSFRFSEDLDFTSLLKKETIEGLINNTIQELMKEAGEVLFKKTESTENSFSGRIFQKLPEFKFPLTVRLEFSFRERPFFVSTSFVETIFPIGPYPQVPHLEIKEIQAEKIRAILTRVRGRDIFDLWFLLSKNILIDWDLVNKKMALYNKIADITTLIQRIEKNSQEEIENDLTKFLPISHRALAKKVKNLVLDKLKN